MYARRVDLVLDTAQTFVGTFYSWGGDDPEGFDCSGLMVELLKVGGLIGRGEDYTAEGLRQKFKEYATQDPQPGSMLFWGNTSKATHVEMVIARIGNDIFTIGASGGHSGVITKEDAAKANAYVKIRMPKDGWFVALQPFWAAQA